MTSPIVPTVHVNGTSREALMAQRSDAIRALHVARKALAEAAPNARDFPSGGYPEAVTQHEQRLDAITKVIRSIDAERQAIFASRREA